MGDIGSTDSGQYFPFPPSPPSLKEGVYDKIKLCFELQENCVKDRSYYDCLQWYFFFLKPTPTLHVATTPSKTTTTPAKEEEKEQKDDKQQRSKNNNVRGQSKEDIVYFKVVSNTDDFPNNDESDQSRTVDLQRGPTCQYHQIPTSQIVSVVWVLWYCWHGYVNRGYISFIDVRVTVKINGDYSLVSIIFSVLVIFFVAVTVSCAVVVVTRFCGLFSVVGIRSSIAASVTVSGYVMAKFFVSNLSAVRLGEFLS